MKVSEEKYKNSMILIGGRAKSGDETIARYSVALSSLLGKEIKNREYQGEEG